MTEAVTITLQPEQRKLVVDWAGEKSSSFHYVWLRHNARCSDGMPNDTSVKIDLLPDAPELLEISACKILDGALLIDWQTDGLQTRHSLETLRMSAYDAAVRCRAGPRRSPPRRG